MDRLGIVLMSAMLLAACASQIPEQTRIAPSRGSSSVADARSGTQRFNGEHVRWGGIIVAVENRASRTWIEVARRHLSNSGKPDRRDHNQGRFMARVEGNLDPAIYARGRHLTVIGDLENGTSGVIDGYAYEHPVVNVEIHHLWAARPNGRNGRGASLGRYARMPVPYAPLAVQILF